jgi:hypothetical protein
VKATDVIEYSLTTPHTWSQALVDREFVHSGRGWKRGAMVASFNGDWFTLETNEFPAHQPHSSTSPTCRGLWKRVGDGESSRFVFELSTALVSGDVEQFEENGALTPESLLDWALVTKQGKVSPNWKPPSGDLIKSWLPSGALTVRAGSLVRQGEITTQGRWHLHFPLLPSVSPDLPDERRVALDLFATDAQSRLRMVRVGWMNDDNGQALVTSVDLTGAPPVPALFLAALEGLFQAVTWLAETAHLLADANVALRSLEMLPAANQARKDSE